LNAVFGNDTKELVSMGNLTKRLLLIPDVEQLIIKADTPKG